MLNEYFSVFHYMRYHFMLFANPTNNRRGISTGSDPAVQSFLIKYCLKAKKTEKQ